MGLTGPQAIPETKYHHMNQIFFNQNFLRLPFQSASAIVWDSRIDFDSGSIEVRP